MKHISFLIEKTHFVFHNHHVSFFGIYKTIDNKTNHSYLIKYTDIPWTAIMGLRDIIAHEYHCIDEEEIFAVMNKDLISLLKIIRQMKMDLETIN